MIIIAIVLLTLPVVPYYKICGFPSVRLEGSASLITILGGSGSIIYENFTYAGTPGNFKSNYKLAYTSVNSVCTELVNVLCNSPPGYASC